MFAVAIWPAYVGVLVRRFKPNIIMGDPSWNVQIGIAWKIIGTQAPDNRYSLKDHRGAHVPYHRYSLKDHRDTRAPYNRYILKDHKSPTMPTTENYMYILSVSEFNYIKCYISIAIYFSPHFVHVADGFVCIDIGI